METINIKHICIHPNDSLFEQPFNNGEEIKTLVMCRDCGKLVKTLDFCKVEIINKNTISC
jgi:hypothetical protein